MTIERVISYVLHTPHNTNRAILTSILEQLILSHGGSLDGPIGPGQDTDHIVYDGGKEE